MARCLCDFNLCLVVACMPSEMLPKWTLPSSPEEQMHGWVGPSALLIYKTTLLDSLVNNWAWSANLGPGPELGLRHEHMTGTQQFTFGPVPIFLGCPFPQLLLILQTVSP